MVDFELILTHIPDLSFASSGQIKLHCTGHKPPLLLGEWPAELIEEDESVYYAAVTAVVDAHRPVHVDAANGKLEP